VWLGVREQSQFQPAICSTFSSHTPSPPSSIAMIEAEHFINFLTTNFLQIYLPILIYYVVGYEYIHHNLLWSSIDSILITTSSMSAGKDLLSHGSSTRIFFSLFTIVGALLLLNLLSSFIIHEVQQARKSMVSPVMSKQISHWSSVYLRRLAYPLVHIALVILLGTVFFAYSEDWTFVDSMYFSVALRSVTGSDGEPLPFSLPCSSLLVDLHAVAIESKIFLLFYQWLFILSIMNFISSLCVLRTEMKELLAWKMQLQRAQNIRRVHRPPPLS
jgi:hypothetical protein